MTGKRIAIVSSRFWPIAGMSQLFAGDLAVGLQQLGNQVEVFTSRWEHRWAKSFSYQGVPVTRMPHPSNGPWRSYRAYRACSRNLTQTEFDAVIFFGLEDHFEQAIKVLHDLPTKVIVRLDDGYDSPVSEKLVNKKSLTVLQQVDQFVCSVPSTCQLLAGQGIEMEKLKVIPDGVCCDHSVDQSITMKNAARTALSDAHPVLAIEPDQPLAIAGMPLNGDAGVFDLIEAWKGVVRKDKRARLWILGDGPQGKALWSQITRANLMYAVIMPGYFDNLEEVFLAADLAIHPCRGELGHGFLIRAMANGVAPLSTDDLNGLIREPVNGMLVGTQDIDGMTEKAIKLLNDSTTRNELGMAANLAVSANRPIQTCIASYAEVIEPCHSMRQASE